MQRCPKCHSQDAMEIVINLEKDDSVKFFQCRDCEGRWWEHAGATIPLEEVLDLTARSEANR